MSDNKNKYVLDALGVTAWHDAGYTGKGVHIASVEDFANAPKNAHASLTCLACKEVAPDAEYHYLPQSRNGAEGKTMSETEFLARLVGRVETENISVWFGSRSSTTDNQLDKALNTVPQLTAFFSAGNTGDRNGSTFINAKNIYGVGAVNVTWAHSILGVPSEGAHMTVVPSFYSSESDAVDFAAPTDIYVNGQQFDGTSCSTPVLAGMAALVNQLFIERTGKPLDRDAMYAFLFDNCYKISGKTHHPKSGWGMPILPPIDSIDFSKYTEADMYFPDIEKHWAESIS